MSEMDLAFGIVAGRHPDCGEPHTPKRKAWVKAHGDELRAELLRIQGGGVVQPSMFGEAA